MHAGLIEVRIHHTYSSLVKPFQFEVNLYHTLVYMGGGGQSRVGGFIGVALFVNTL